MGGARARALYLVQATVKVERRLCIHSFQISSRSIHCQCNSMRAVPFILGPNVGRARNRPSRRPAALYECFFEQWARVFGRVMTRPTRPTRPVPPGLYNDHRYLFQAGSCTLLCCGASFPLDFCFTISSMTSDILLSTCGPSSCESDSNVCSRIPSIILLSLVFVVTLCV